MLTIRSARPADISTLQSLARSIWNAVYPPIIEQAQIDYMLDSMYSAVTITAEMDDGVAWEIVEFNGGPIGFLSTHLDPDVALKVSKIYLEPATHGRGFGQEVLKHIDAKAQSLNAASIYLFVNRSNERALRAYFRAGYCVVGSMDQPYGDFILNDFKLAKTL